MTPTTSVWDDLDIALGGIYARSSEHSVWDALSRALMPIEARPRVVRDIEASHQTTRNGVAYVIIRNPEANTYLKLDPREYALLPLMDGTRTVKALVVEY